MLKNYKDYLTTIENYRDRLKDYVSNQLAFTEMVTHFGKQQEAILPYITAMKDIVISHYECREEKLDEKEFAKLRELFYTSFDKITEIIVHFDHKSVIEDYNKNCKVEDFYREKILSDLDQLYDKIIISKNLLDELN
jgi:hypothetical protein